MCIFGKRVSSTTLPSYLRIPLRFEIVVDGGGCKGPAVRFPFFFQNMSPIAQTRGYHTLAHPMEQVDYDARAVGHTPPSQEMGYNRLLSPGAAVDDDNVAGLLQVMQQSNSVHIY